MNQEYLQMNDLLIIELANLLKNYLETDLNQTFRRTRYDFPDLTEDQRVNLDNQESLTRQIMLKEYACIILGGSFEEWDKDAWIVHNWGGIHKFKIDNHQRIIEFRDALYHGHTAHFECISSLSKIASFIRPDQFFVYDSRVAFALNGLLLECLKKFKRFSRHLCFFPIPHALGGRDKDMNDIIAKTVKSPQYYSKQEAYIVYNQLIRRLYVRLFTDNTVNQPCRVEMLLYELGKTEGIIAHLLGMIPQKDKESSRNQNNDKEDVSVLKEGKKVFNRIVFKGYIIVQNGVEYYFFVGKDKRKSYCELLSKEKIYPNEAFLLENGFDLKGGRSPYFIKLFDKDEVRTAITFMDGLKKSLFKKLQHPGNVRDNN